MIAVRTGIPAVPAALAVATLAAAPADAASLQIRSDSARVTASGRAAIVLHNPGRRAVAGRLTLRAGAATIAAARVRLPARTTRSVRVRIVAASVRRLERDGRLAVRAIVRGRGVRTVQRSVLLVGRSARAAPQPSVPSVPSVPQQGPPATATPAPATTPPRPAPPWSEGRYHGRYADNNADLAFNVIDGRLYTGPFDSFYAEAVCRNVDPSYTGPDQTYPSSRAIEPVEAAIGGDGSFAGEGLYHPGSGSQPISWRLTGRLSGGDVRGEFAVSFIDAYGNPCQATASFVARYTSAYVIGT